MAIRVDIAIPVVRDRRLGCRQRKIQPVSIDLKNERVAAIAASCDGMIATQDEAVRDRLALRVNQRLDSLVPFDRSAIAN
jgi:hypothetical protein